MQDKQVMIAFMTFFHDLFTTVWVGGIISLGVIVMPSVKKVLGMGPQTKQLMEVIQKRLSKFVYVSIIGLIITGILKSKSAPGFLGIFHFGNTYSMILGIKHLLVIVMIVVAILRSQIVGRKKAPSPEIEKAKAGLLFFNMLLGILVLLLSGFTIAAGVTPPV